MRGECNEPNQERITSTPALTYAYSFHMANNTSSTLLDIHSISIRTLTRPLYTTHSAFHSFLLPSFSIFTSTLSNQHIHPHWLFNIYFHPPFLTLHCHSPLPHFYRPFFFFPKIIFVCSRIFEPWHSTLTAPLV